MAKIAGSTMTLAGEDALTGRLNKLDKNIRKRVMKAAVAAGGSEILKTARKKAPKRSGLLAKALAVKSITYRHGEQAVAVIGARRGAKLKSMAKIRSAGGAKIKAAEPSNYAHLVEFGTRAHPISAKGEGFLSFLGVVTKAVMHPGAKPRPFLGPAYTSSISRAFKRMGAKAWQGIEKQAKKK